MLQVLLSLWVQSVMSVRTDQSLSWNVEITGGFSLLGLDLAIVHNPTRVLIGREKIRIEHELSFSLRLSCGQ